VSFDDLGSDALLLNELHRRQEEVHEQAPFGGVEIVEQGNNCWVFKAFVAQILSNDSPVFFFDVGIVVALVLA
jgi:hypothetical protein